MKLDAKKIVVAYSGGLDTSAIITWLKQNSDAEVIAWTADVGQGERQQHVAYLVGRAFGAYGGETTSFCDYTPQSTVADYTRYGTSLTRAVALSVEGALSLRPPPPPPPRPPPPPVPASCASFPEFMVRPLSSSFENGSRELKNAPVDLPQVFSNIVTEACCDAPGVTCPCAHTLTVSTR